MASAYSQDLRDRVIDAVVRGGMSRRAAGARFGVSESSAIKWVHRFSFAKTRCFVGRERQTDISWKLEKSCAGLARLKRGLRNGRVYRALVVGICRSVGFCNGQATSEVVRI